jgi:phage baseplate assembly protein W
MQIITNNFSDLPMFLSKNFFTRDINLKKDSLAIKDSVKNIVLTRVGERPFDLSFTGYVYDLLFENVIDSQMIQYKVHLSNIIGVYEPRVEVTDVLIQSNDKTVTVEIIYNIKSLDRTDSIEISMERTR